MVADLIKYFKIVAVTPEMPHLDPVIVNREAVKAGYAVAPEACIPEVLAFLKEQSSNFNTTFYSSWKEVKDLSERQMILLQLVHYLSTYGSDYAGETFTMNPAPAVWHFDSLKVISPCTPRELFDRMVSLAAAPVALSSAVVKAIGDQLLEYYREYGWKVECTEVLNRELRALLYLGYKELPSDPEEFIRLLVLVSTGKTLVIKNQKTWNDIINSHSDVATFILACDDKAIEGLAAVYYRYKPIFLALRHAIANTPKTKECRAVLNRIARIAHRFKKPAMPSPLQAVLSGKYDTCTIESAIVAEKNPFILIRLLNYLGSITNSDTFHSYIIRNGKVFVKQCASAPSKCLLAGKYRKKVLGRLSELLRRHYEMPDGTMPSVALPENVELAAPVSEKMFVGNLPYGSCLPLKEHSFAGVYWRNEWGTRDFDLWVIGAEGSRLGWSGEHKNESILFSGDMTDAEPEATEIMYCSGNWPDCTIRVNRYNGEPGSKFRIFFGTQEMKELPLNYMVDPASLVLTEDMVSDSRETTIGVVKSNKVYFMGLSTGNGLIPGYEVSYEDAFAVKFSHFVSLKEVLLEGGFRIVSPEDSATADISLVNLDKDTILKFFLSE